uniref:Protein RFT1 homolog n=1 Tax=Panagrellus redivivus TaxID=6233 RepID=A0A7E4URV5_PANRE
MASPFLDILKYNLSGQFLARLLSFAISAYLVRHVPMNLLGLINVRMYLLYSTICFLVREPFRKTCMNADLTVKQAQKYAFLCVPFSIVVTFIITFLFTIRTSTETGFDDHFFTLSIIFGASALIETFVEPCAIFALKMGQNKLFSITQSISTFLPKFIAFVLIVGTNTSPIVALSYSQLASSLVYAIIYIVSFMRSRYPFEEHGRQYSYEKSEIKLMTSLVFHSSLKQVLTEGAGYVMVFMNVLSLEQQGVYNTIERLGSLVTRLVLTPLEESAFMYFSTRLNRQSGNTANSSKKSAEAEKTYFAVLRIIISVGLTVFVFGLPYSALVIRLYGGQVLVDNQGHQMLMAYLVYLLIMAVNGLTECFAFASMNSSEILFHGYILTGSIILHLILNWALSFWIGAFGFIFANCVNSALRIYFNYRYISGHLKSLPSIFTILPSLRLCGSLLLNFGIIFIASLIFGSDPNDISLIIANVAIGGILFLAVIVYLHQNEHLFTPLMEKQD